MKTKTEAQTRKGLMEHARRIGAAEDLAHLFDYWDKILILAPPSEKSEVSKMAILEVQNLLDIHGGLTVNGEIVVPNKEEKN